MVNGCHLKVICAINTARSLYPSLFLDTTTVEENEVGSPAGALVEAKVARVGILLRNS